MEASNDSVVQKCIRTLRDDFDKQELYRLKISRPLEKGQLQINKEKIKAECPSRSMFTLKNCKNAKIIIHQRKIFIQTVI
jgi:hypothetical protein